MGITVVPECYRHDGVANPRLLGFNDRRTLGWAAAHHAEHYLNTPIALLEAIERSLRVRAQVENEQGEPQGDLRVTCSTAMGERFVAPIIRRFAMPHPKLNVTIDLSNHVVDLVAEGYDLGIRTGLVSDSRLIATRVASHTLLTCAAPSYLAHAGTPRSVLDLGKHQCITGSSATWHFNRRGKDLACCRFGGHRDKVFSPIGEQECREGSSAASLSARR